MAAELKLNQPPMAGFMQDRRLSRLFSRIFVYAMLIFLSMIFLFPFFWMITTALKPSSQVFLWPPRWLPNPADFSNFTKAFSNPQLPFDVFIRNTLWLEVAIIVGRLLSCTLVAYGFARLEGPGKNVLFIILLATLMLPNAAVLIPRYVMFSSMGWVNTFNPLIIPSWFGEAYAIFLMRQFFMTIPRELEESARIDGASSMQIIFRIIVPLSVPVLTVITILSFKDIWNEFFNPMLYLNEVSKYTVAIGLAYFNGQFRVEMNQLMAASVTLMMPVILLFIIAQRSFIEGITLTGIKG